MPLCKYKTLLSVCKQSQKTELDNLDKLSVPSTHLMYNYLKNLLHCYAGKYMYLKH